MEIEGILITEYKPLPNKRIIFEKRIEGDIFKKCVVDLVVSLKGKRKRGNKI